VIELIILTSLIIIISCYVIVAKKEKNFFNIFFPKIFFLIPAVYIFELLNIFFGGYSGSLFAYFYCYLTYTMSFIAIVYAYLKFPNISIKLPFTKNYQNNLSFFSYSFLLSAYLLYLPILIEYKEFILSPRDIYTHTRTGYGLQFFLSTTLVYIAFILYLFKENRRCYGIYIFSILCIFILLMHGSKIQILALAFIYLFYLVYVKQKVYTFFTFVFYGSVFTIMVAVLFYVTLPATMKINFIKGVSAYSSYTRNAMLVIDSDMKPQMGRLTAESQIFSRVPRAIYPDKPKDFADFYLAKVFFREWFEADTGSPSFGMVGRPYADFGIFAIFYIVFVSFITGVLLKMFMTRLRRYRNPFDFILVLFFSGVGLIPLGIGYLWFEHLIIAFGLGFLLHIRFKNVQKRNFSFETNNS
jgi:hypothetical protein